MSVLACDRKGCKSIMCDRVSYTHGYLCESCFQELVSQGPLTCIHTFMESEKPAPGRMEQARARYSAEFKLRGE